MTCSVRQHAGSAPVWLPFLQDLCARSREYPTAISCLRPAGYQPAPVGAAFGVARGVCPIAEGAAGRTILTRLHVPQRGVGLAPGCSVP